MKFSPTATLRRPLALAAIVGTVALAACSTTGPAGNVAATGSAFSVQQFAWSALPGRNTIQGQIASSSQGVPYACIGSAGLTPETPYTRARFETLYGSTQRAELPAAVVRARTIEDAQADYRGFVRSEACDANRFTFNGLPDGNWFVIVPVRAAQGDVTVLMRRVQTRGGRVSTLAL